MRGATNAIFSVKPENRINGFTCHSSGNHGQAVAYASKIARSKAYIVMPNNSTKVKIDAVRAYGAEVVLCEPGDESRQSVCDEVMEKTGAKLIHPFDDYDIIAGQATAAKELIEETERLDCLMTPVGGGGLSAGTALMTKHLLPSAPFYLSEPKEVDDTSRSLKAGKIIPNKTLNTIADGLKTTIGERNFAILKETTADIFTVSEEEIVTAMKLIWERMKIIIEPSCAVPFAAVLQNRGVFKDKNVGIIITGGNVDLTRLPF